ncbi:MULTISPECIES: RagB/SusD family nutrient uptake outer membrane protein [Salegentibacter]|uniref:Starch-binding associating with outer membrane n=1 Tax=Salegentibacter agarivorans TaxID=345907 RepID=A0A1I2LW29_9FLAO|nr:MULTISPECIES: RagB/SusD family nutrient uptake outer membrane protein [Salegentibacter]SFF82818.1 Starch-binding associating with outer membrane [Salegentibacter agarivorans]
MKKIVVFSVILSMFCLVGCEKDFLDRAPNDELTDETFWENEEHLRLAANALYANVKAKNTVDQENMGDNTLWPSTTQYQRIGSGNYNSDLNTLNTEWTTQYRGIRQANSFLANYQKAEVDDPLVAERYAAEVRVIRALMYLYITEFWGDMPLVTEPLNIDELMIPRDPKEEVVDFVLNDLEDAAQYLPEEIPSGENLGRMNKGAALALKARMALYNERYDVAEDAAKRVMDMGVYELYSTGNPESDYYDLFTYEGKLANGNNKETIIARLSLEDEAMHNLSREIHVPDQVIRWNPTKSLVDSYLMADGLPIDKSPLYSVETYEDVFENRDPRMTQTILEPGSEWGGRYDGRENNENPEIFEVPKFQSDGRGAVTLTGYYFTKYAEPSAVPTYNRDFNDIHLLRYAEVLLTYAEARFEQGVLSQEDLDISINLLRERVAMQPMVLADLESNGLDLREEIRRERRVELALEGQRYFDIKRWKQGELLASDVKGTNVKWLPNPAMADNLRTDENGFIIALTDRVFDPERHYLWPVPLPQLERNPDLVQNPGW